MAEDTTPKPESVDDEALAAKWEDEKKKLNDENAARRREAKAANKTVEILTKQLGSIKESLGIESDEELEAKISEYRAAAEKGSKTGNDLVALQTKLSAAEKERSKLKSDLEAKSKDFESVAARLNSTLIGHELQRGFSTFDVRDDQRDVLETFLTTKGHVKVNEKGKAVWVVRDEDGDEVGDKSIKDGLTEFFENNKSFLPASTPEGTGKGPTPKVKPGRTDLSVASVFGSGIAGYREKRKELGLDKKA